MSARSRSKPWYRLPAERLADVIPLEMARMATLVSLDDTYAFQMRRIDECIHEVTIMLARRAYSWPCADCGQQHVTGSIACAVNNARIAEWVPR